MIVFLHFARRAALALAFAGLIAGAPAAAATPAEVFVSGNIQKSLSILDDSHLTAAQRGEQFRQFLLGVTDLKRVATFTLGSYGARASDTDKAAFAAAFQNYALAVYRSYFSKYAGQTLTVTGSTQHAADDAVVMTALTDPAEHGRTMEVDFRVRSNADAPTIVDFSVAGIWLAPEERDQFVAFLDRNNGSIPSLIAHLDELRAKFGG
ncbi:MAG: ABC transporter substrate-binding protein [Rhizomicrobium sp.]